MSRTQIQGKYNMKERKASKMDRKYDICQEGFTSKQNAN